MSPSQCVTHDYEAKLPDVVKLSCIFLAPVAAMAFVLGLIRWTCFILALCGSLLIAAPPPVQNAVCYHPFHLPQYPINGAPVDVNALAAAIDRDFAQMAQYVSVVRTYYSEFFGIQVAPIAAKYNIQLYLGVFLTTQWWYANQVNAAVDAVQQYPNTVLAILVGNENLRNPRLNFGTNSADEILAAANGIRSAVWARCNRWVALGTAQRITEWLEDSILGETTKLKNGLDILGANIYPFYDNSYNRNDPLRLLNLLWGLMINRYGVDKPRLTETGYPSAGHPSSVAPNVWPSLADEAIYYQAVTSWQPSQGGGPLFWYQFYDLPDNYGVPEDHERYFGLVHADGSSKSNAFPTANWVPHILWNYPGKVLTAYGTDVFSDWRRGNPNERWSYNAGTQQFRVELTGQCLDAFNDNGTFRVHTWPCDAGNQNQKWIIDVGENSIRHAYHPNVCLDADPNDKASRVQVWGCHPFWINPNQWWQVKGL
ncbi:Aste57867_16192 [Aphanomyces stellatus]|uniref:glucan endo-1,3-beta-D-glucosidase n=1 Tax=Aphanomyces stellatus TaxID=120398 RepID=A0A485L5M7_9STRA|nr:hypothetical protein As57867_016136 [Aphanomyces stellatus]VFT92970.1 Aste57867_16192 [Aphanomyces stellatus]